MSFSLQAVVLFPGVLPPEAWIRARLAARLGPRMCGHDETVELWALPEELLPEGAGSSLLLNPGARALLLHCQVIRPVPPGSRPTVYRQMLGALAACGAHGAWLPASMKWISAPAMQELGAEPAPLEVLLSALLTRHCVTEKAGVWLHTHGMAHFGLPELECRAPHAERGDAERLLEGAIDYLLTGGDAFSPGAVIEVYEGLDAVRFEVTEAEPLAEHGSSAFGTWELRMVAFPGREAGYR